METAVYASFSYGFFYCVVPHTEQVVEGNNYQVHCCPVYLAHLKPSLCAYVHAKVGRSGQHANFFSVVGSKFLNPAIMCLRGLI